MKYLNVLILLTIAMITAPVFSLAGFQNPDLIISASKAIKLFDKAGIIIIDVRTPQNYSEGHISHSINIPLSQLTRSEKLNNSNESKGLLIKAKPLTKILQSAGINTHSKIIVYSNAGDSRASQFWWLMTQYGHFHTRVVDGGFQALDEDAASISFSTYKSVTKGNFVADVKFNNFVNFDYVLSKVGDRQVQFIDGIDFITYSKGHIKNAQSLHYKNTFDTEGKLKKPEILKQQLIDAGIEKGKQSIFYCGGGWYSAHNYLVASSLGFDNITIYEGSRKDWIPRNGPLVSANKHTD